MPSGLHGNGASPPSVRLPGEEGFWQQQLCCSGGGAGRALVCRAGHGVAPEMARVCVLYDFLPNTSSHTSLTCRNSDHADPRYVPLQKM